jgi:hypothetical protein
MPCARAFASATLDSVCVTHHLEIDPATGTEGLGSSAVFVAVVSKSAGEFISSLMR